MNDTTTAVVPGPASAPARPPLPPFDEAGARAKVQAAEDAWNSRDPQRMAAAYTPDSQWRNRGEFLTGRLGARSDSERDAVLPLR